MRRQVHQACRGDRAAAALRRQQLRSRNQLAAFAYVGAYPCIELAPLARISAMDEPVAVAARRAAFWFLYRGARKIFMKAGFNPLCVSLNRLMPLAIRSRRQHAFARPERSFPDMNIRCCNNIRACGVTVSQIKESRFCARDLFLELMDTSSLRVILRCPPKAGLEG